MRGQRASSLLFTAVRSLNFSEDRGDLLTSIDPDQWEGFLSLTDEARITLPLATRCRHAIPEPVRSRLDECLTRNAVRHTRIVEAHAGIVKAMESRGAQFLVLKGLTHGSLWSGDSAARPQYDIDLYCPPASIGTAVEAAASLGYAPFGHAEKGADHLPVMIRATGWRWRGDYYDPEQPLALELHHRFWNPALGFQVHGAERFWDCHVTAVIDGIALPALHPVDALEYAAWHAVRHLLGGNLRIHHVYELAHYLHHTGGDHEFWKEWLERGAPGERLPASIAFRLAHEWFGCRLNPIADDCLRDLPAGIERWFRLFAMSPIMAVGNSNKDELFLNLCLAESRAERWRIAARRIVPVRAPATLHKAHIPQETAQLRSERALRRLEFMAQRAFHHLRAVAPVMRSGLRWWLSDHWLRRTLEP